jgi:peptidyl-prolyl cis-trans isomerase C
MLNQYVFCMALGLAAVVPAAMAADSPATSPAPAAAKSSDKVSALFEDKVIVKAKGFEIKRSQLDEEVIRVKAQLSAQGQPVTPERVAMLEQGVLEQLVGLQILTGKATDPDRAAGKELAEKRFEDIKKRLGSDEVINMKLKAEGITKEELMRKWSQQATAETVVRRELGVNVSDEDVKKFYDENPTKFEQPEMVRASHILLSTRDAQQKELPPEQKAEKRKTMDSVLKRAKAGEDFAKLAKEFSEDPGSKENGGEYTFGRGRMVPEFEAAAFSLSPGQISDVVTTQFGYHIIKLSEKLPPKKIELASVSKDVKEMLTQQALQQKLPDYMKKIKDEAAVEIVDPKFKKDELPSAPAGSPAPAPAK